MRCKWGPMSFLRTHLRVTVHWIQWSTAQWNSTPWADGGVTKIQSSSIFGWAQFGRCFTLTKCKPRLERTGKTGHRSPMKVSQKWPRRKQNKIERGIAGCDFRQEGRMQNSHLTRSAAPGYNLIPKGFSQNHRNSCRWWGSTDERSTTWEMVLGQMRCTERTITDWMLFPWNIRPLTEPMLSTNIRND